MNLWVKPYCIKQRKKEGFRMNLEKKFPALDLVPEAVSEDFRETL